MTNPAAAHNFQSTNRYRQRGYTDTLPPCDINPEPDGEWVPGFTSLKPKKPFYKKLDGTAYRMDVVSIATHFAGMHLPPEPRDCAEAFTNAIDAQFAEATGRGTEGHAFFESLVLGYDPDPLFHEKAADYLPAIRSLVADLGLGLGFVEVVVFGDGWAGTCDGFLTVDALGGTYVVDLKTRGPDSAHGCYEEEVAQLGAYASASYMIVADGDTAVRRRLPTIDGGLVLSVRPDGYEVYPVDLTEATAAWEAMHDSAERLRAFGQWARKAKGKPLDITPAAPAEPTDILPARRQALRARIAGLSDERKAELRQRWEGPRKVDDLDADQVTALDSLVSTIEADHEDPFAGVNPDEATDGALSPNHPDVVAVIARANALPDDLRLAANNEALIDHDVPPPVDNAGRGRWRREHIRIVETAIARQEQVREHRNARIASMFAGNDWSTHVTNAIGDEPHRWTAADVEAAEALVAALEAGVARPSGHGVTVDEAVLVSKVGSKSAVRDAGKELADDPIRSAADVAADPVLAARVLAGATS